MGRILGLDYGTRRIGVALSDLLGMTAQPFVVHTRKSLKDDMLQLGVIVKEQQVTKIVVGYPINMDGSEGPLAREAKTFAEHIGKELNVPVELYDERLTTMQSERILVEEADMSREKRKLVRDKVAASILLQAYLDQHRLY